MTEVTQERLKELLHYNRKTGDFVWKKRDPAEWSTPAKGRAWNSRYAGKRAGVVTHGYIKISVDGRKYYAHRLAWVYVTGCFPDILIDHINHDGTDNRRANLRLADKAKNARNVMRPRSNRTGFTGVVELPSGRFMAQKKGAGRQRYLGAFDTPEEAHAAYLRAI